MNQLEGKRAKRLAIYREDADVVETQRHEKFVDWFFDALTGMRAAVAALPPDLLSGLEVAPEAYWQLTGSPRNGNGMCAHIKSYPQHYTYHLTADMDYLVNEAGDIFQHRRKKATQSSLTQLCGVGARQGMPVAPELRRSIEDLALDMPQSTVLLLESFRQSLRPNGHERGARPATVTVAETTSAQDLPKPRSL